MSNVFGFFWVLWLPHSPKTYVRPIGNLILSVGVNVRLKVCLCPCVSVMSRRLIQGVDLGEGPVTAGLGASWLPAQEHVQKMNGWMDEWKDGLKTFNLKEHQFACAWLTSAVSSTHLSSQAWAAPRDPVECWHKSCSLLLGQTSLQRRTEADCYRSPAAQIIEVHFSLGVCDCQFVRFKLTTAASTFQWGKKKRECRVNDQQVLFWWNFSECLASRFK